MRPHDGVFDVYGVVAHAPQHKGLVQGADDEDGVVEVTVSSHGLRPPEEPQVTGPSIQLTTGTSRHQPGTEVVLNRGKPGTVNDA